MGWLFVQVTGKACQGSGPSQRVNPDHSPSGKGTSGPFVGLASAGRAETQPAKFLPVAGTDVAWLRMLRNVPTEISDFLGTMAVSTHSRERRTNLT